MPWAHFTPRQFRRDSFPYCTSQRPGGRRELAGPDFDGSARVVSRSEGKTPTYRHAGLGSAHQVARGAI